MRCTNCGFEMNTDNVAIKFCPVCGSKFGDGEERLPMPEIAEEEETSEVVENEWEEDIDEDIDEDIEEDEEPEDGDFDEEESDEEEDEDFDEDEEAVEEEEKSEAETVEPEAPVAEEVVVVEKVVPTGAGEGLAGNLLKKLTEDYNRDLIEKYVDCVWDNAETRFVSIDKSYAPKIFDGEEKITSVEPFAKHLKEYNARIKEEIDSVAPRLKAVAENRKKRLGLEKRQKIAAIRRNGNIKNFVAVAVALICAVISAIVLATTNNYPYFDVFLAGLLFGIPLIVVTASVVLSLRWWLKYRKVGGLRKLMRFVFSIVAVLVISLDVYFLKLWSASTSAPYSTTLLIATHLMGLGAGMGVGLFVRTLYVAVKRARYYKRIKMDAPETEGILAGVKKNSLRFVIVVMVFSVLFTSLGFISRNLVDVETGDFSVKGNLQRETCTLTGVSEEYLKGCGDTFGLPLTVADREIGMIGKDLFPENNQIKVVTLRLGVLPEYGALRTATKIEELTAVFNEDINLEYYFGGKVPESLKKVTVLTDAAYYVSVYDGQFKGASGLTSVTFSTSTYAPGSVSSGLKVWEVGADAFAGTAMLQNAYSSNGVKYLYINNKKIAVDTVENATQIAIASDTDLLAKGVFQNVAQQTAGTVNITLPYGGLRSSDAEGNDELSAKDYLFNGTAATVNQLTLEDVAGTLNWNGITVNEFECQDLANLSVSTVLGTECARRLQKVKVNSGNIPQYAFGNCDNLRTVVLGRGVYRISNYAVPWGSRITVYCYNGEENYDFDPNWDYNSDVEVIFNWSDDFERVTQNGFTYILDNGVGTAKITSYSGTAKSLNIDKVNYGGKTYQITEIADNAFENNRNLQNVTFGKDLKKIGGGAFSGCSGLQFIYIPNSVTQIGYHAFWEVDGKIFVHVAFRPSAWDSTWANAHENNVYYSVSACGVENGFQYYVKDEKLYIFGYENAEQSVVTVPLELGGEPVYEIADAAFYNHTAITEVVITKNVAVIRNTAFKDCSNLQKVTIEEVGNDLSLCYRAFFGCIALKEIFLPNRVATVEENVFSAQYTAPYCSRAERPSTWSENWIDDESVVTWNVVAYGTQGDFSYVIHGDDTVSVVGYTGKDISVEIPETIEGKTVTQIDRNVFAGYADLVELILPVGLEEFDGGYFTGNHKLVRIRNLSENLWLESFGNVEVIQGSRASYESIFAEENGVQTYQRNGTLYFFGYRGTATQLDLSGYDFTAVWHYAVAENGKLRKITLPDTVISIDESAFENCTSLTELYLPASVENVGENALKGCEKLTVKYAGDLELPKGFHQNWNPDECPVDWINYVDVEVKVDCYVDAAAIADKLDGRTNTVSDNGLEVATVTGHSWRYATLNNTGSGAKYIKSGIEGLHNSEATLTIEATMNCVISFVFNVNSEPKYDFGYVYYNGDQEVSASGGYSGAYEKALSAGDTVLLKYVKDNSSNEGFDCAYLTNFQITAEGEYTVKAKTEGDYNYVVEDGKITLVRYANGSDGEFVAQIPSTIEGKPVTKIAQGCFQDKYYLSALVITENVTDVNRRAVINCPKLVHIKNHSFADIDLSDCDAEVVGGNEDYTTELTSNGTYHVFVKDGVKYLFAIHITGELDLSATDITAVWQYACYQHEFVTNVILPEGVTSIGEGAFQGCTNLTELHLPESVTEIGKNAVAGCDNLTVYFGGLPEDMVNWDADWNPDPRPLEYTNYAVYTLNDFIECVDGEEHVFQKDGVDIITVETSCWEYGSLKYESEPAYLKSTVEKYSSGTYPVSVFKITASVACEINFTMFYDTLNAVYGNDPVVVYLNSARVERYYGNGSFTFMRELKAGDCIEIQYQATARMSDRKDAIWFTALSVIAEKEGGAQ